MTDLNRARRAAESEAASAAESIARAEEGVAAQQGRSADMTSALQQPRHGHEESPRRFVGFPFRLHAHTQANGSRDVRRLDREVMCKGEHQGLDGVEPSNTFIGFLPGKPLTTVTFTSE